jgi:hypothetical protein
MIQDEKLRNNFWAKVDKTDSCWNWTAAKKQLGYGLFKVGRKTVLAHRLAYQWQYGEIPDGLFCCHTCDNPACVNPAHIFLGTAADNNADRDRKGRLVIPESAKFKVQSHCVRGHELIPENVYSYQVSATKTHRVCKKCRVIMDRIYYHRRKARAASGDEAAIASLAAHVAKQKHRYHLRRANAAALARAVNH